MKNFIKGIGLLAIVIINGGCPKPCIDVNYSFNVNLKIIPDLDSIKVGDTLYIVSTFPTNLIDQRSGTEINYNNASDIESTLSIAELITGNNIPKGSVYNFDYLSQIGMIYNSKSNPSPETVQQLKYQEVGSSYQLKVGLIPQRKGIFALGIGNGLSNGRSKSKNCEKAGFNFTIASTSQHIYYYQNWRPGNNLSAADISKLYCFKVY